MEENPSSFELLVMAGQLAYLEKQPADSAKTLERADKIKSLGGTNRVTLVLAYAFSKNPAQPRVELQKLMKIAPWNCRVPICWDASIT